MAFGIWPKVLTVVFHCERRKGQVAGFKNRHQRGGTNSLAANRWDGAKVSLPGDDGAIFLGEG